MIITCVINPVVGKYYTSIDSVQVYVVKKINLKLEVIIVRNTLKPGKIILPYETFFRWFGDQEGSDTNDDL